MQRYISEKVLLPFTITAMLTAGGASGAENPAPNAVPAPAAKGTLTLTVNGTVGNGNVVAQNGLGVRTLLKEGANALNAGNYVIIAKGIRRPGPIVDGLLIGAINAPAVAITAGKTVVRTATYIPGGGGRLWLPASGTKTLHGYGQGQLAVPNTNGPGKVTITGAGVAPFGMAFDAAGNMFVADRDDDSVLIYSARQSTVSGSGAPIAKIANTPAKALDGPVGLAFDATGNLWVTNYIGNSLVKYTAVQLASTITLKGTRTPVPSVIIHSTAFIKPYGQAFDKAGNLWVANNGANTVLEFAKASLATSGAIVPTRTEKRTTTAAVLNKPRSPAFDAVGSLWIANNATSQVVKYAINATTGVPTPIVTATLKLNSTTNAVPTGLAIDNAGNLWVTDSPHSTLLKYSIGSLTNGASAIPVTTITGYGTTGGVLFGFNPPSAKLPLAQK